MGRPNGKTTCPSLLAALLAVLASLATQTTHAQDDRGGADFTLTDATDRGLTDARSVWQEREPRWFAAGIIDAGWLWARPRIQLGYGRPHWLWGGVEAYPVLSGSHVGAFLGVRLEVPHFTVRAGSRYEYSLIRGFIEPQNQFDRADIERLDDEHATYFATTLEVSGSVPLGPGGIISLLNIAYLSGVPAGRYIFEEGLHVVADPPWVWRVRLGYAFRMSKDPPVSLGLAGDVVGNPGRGEQVYRAGIVVNAILWDDLELLGTLMPVVHSPDALGLVGGDYASLGLRYRWATGGTPW